MIVKHLNAIQNFGAMDAICTDKTGALIQGARSSWKNIWTSKANQRQGAALRLPQQLPLAAVMISCAVLTKAPTAWFIGRFGE